jgi:hypothetical protein
MAVEIPEVEKDIEKAEVVDAEEGKELVTIDLDENVLNSAWLQTVTEKRRKRSVKKATFSWT